MADAQTALLMQYKLCKWCIERHASRAKAHEHCHICRGLMDSLDTIADRIIDSVKGYEFKTFLIGATLPSQIYEREDAMRARLKIRGMENIKNQLTKQLGMGLARLARKRVDYLKPDLVINLIIDKENNVDIAVKSRPIIFNGKYVKRSRGLPQKQDRCQHCEGNGCDFCSYSGLSGYSSIEGIIAKGLVEITGGQVPRFSWIGSEDQSSLVLGTGRPFYVRVFNPKKRSLKKKNRTVRSGGVTATLSVIDDDEPEFQPRFKVKTKIHVKCENQLSKEDMKNLNSLAGTEVLFENKLKMVAKKLYFAKVRKIGSNQFSLTLVADGGLIIKQFVGGEEYMKPSISGILGCRCECLMFDILRVEL